ncbi:MULTISPECIES: hypothetical protein [Elizabethkingia]|uniref:hypothetical protein n=1 Tax=Elizabethkingia TaxID=308865 RepID=UPI000842122E|nr:MULTISPECIES: hypothetical protein [Elizabethkingia]ODM52202.1 hypothetical protein BES09_15605 [Elizabethkingia meningoseptica]OHT26996.1 hypothetical protein BFF93_15770 [Elizabethkingia meningoseptica]OPC10860.1 hypothetical protein BAX93_10545 [Elizabethkingia meningoseptica]UIO95071.1 hypothetical protein LYZ41_12805 [Elizabethkingia miricola]WNG63993.1 hypothetical protein M9H57_13700 [Elizabethkingia miricola]
MKKLLLFLLSSSFAFGQLSQDSIQKIAKKKFEEDYVATRFKDPYSYEFKNIWSTVTTVEENWEAILRSDKSYTESTYANKKFVKQMKDTLKKHQAQLDILNEAQRKSVYIYNIFIDAYGANSYGNKVLGRYIIKLYPNGKLYGGPEKYN